MKKILILGSAPNASIPVADFAYCANASASYFQEQLTQIGEIVSVVGEHCIAAVPGSAAPESVKIARELIIESKNDISIIRHQPWFDGWNLDLGLEDMKAKYRWISHSERSTTIMQTSELSEPIISHTLLYESIKRNPIGFLRNMNSLFRQNRRAKKKGSVESHAVLRPSTGLLAAMIAMSEHGLDAKYILSGINLSIFSDRTSHHKGPTQQAFHGITHHIHADRKIFYALKRRYNIEYINPRS